jgi:hypothetical protein
MSPPELGGDMTEVMSALGYSDDEQAAFVADGVIKVGDEAAAKANEGAAMSE